jgi:phenylacetate-CoA ligase
MFLQEWIFSQIKQNAIDYSGKDMASKALNQFTSHDIDSFKLAELKKTLGYVYSKSSFYQKLFSTAGVKPDDIQGFTDLRKIPFTNPTDLAESPYRFLCVSLQDVKRIYTLTTAGTTGNPKKLFFTKNDLEITTDYMGAGMRTVAALGGLGSQGYKVMILLPDRKPESQAKLLSKGIEKFDGVPVTTDISLNYADLAKVIAEVKPDIVFGSVSRIWRIAQELNYDLRKIGLKIVFLTSEYLSHAKRKKIEQISGCQVFLHYGMTEMGFAGGIECSAHDGFHFNELDFIFEVINPVTGEVLEEGKEGELVFTTLSREGMPLIRYRTGDLTYQVSSPCKCGASKLHRLGRIVKRIDGIRKIGDGEEIFPALIDDALDELPINIIDYRATLSRERDKDLLTCKIATSGDEAYIKEIAEAITSIPPVKKSIEARLMSPPRVEIVDRESIRRQGRTKQSIIDNRH